MTVYRMDHVGIVVEDLAAAIAFFQEVGLELEGRTTVEGEWVDKLVALPGVRSDIAFLRTPDGHGRIELFHYRHPEAIETEPVEPNTIGMHRVAFAVDDIEAAVEIVRKHGGDVLRGIAQYEDIYRLTYVRGPEGILLMLAQELRKAD